MWFCNSSVICYILLTFILKKSEKKVKKKWKVSENYGYIDPVNRTISYLFKNILLCIIFYNWKLLALKINY